MSAYLGIVCTVRFPLTPIDRLLGNHWGRMIPPLHYKGIVEDIRFPLGPLNAIHGNTLKRQQTLPEQIEKKNSATLNFLFYQDVQLQSYF